MSTLDEGLYALACDGDIRCLTTLVRSFKWVKIYREHGFTVVNSYQRPPPHVRATMEDISQPGSSAAIEYRSDKMVLNTWHYSSTFVEEFVYDFVTPRFMPQHDSSTPAKNSVCESITPRCMPQHGSNTPAKDSICKSVTPRCMPHGMLTPPIDESVITYTQLSGVQGAGRQDHVIEDVMRQLSFEETKLDGDAGYGDVAGGGMDSYGLSRDESFGFDDLDLNVRIDEVVDSSVEEDVVHGSGKEDAEQGDDLDVVNLDGFDNDTRNDNETSTYRSIRSKEANDRACLNSIESRRMLKLYKNDKIRGPFPYQVLATVELDSNNGIYPLDYALVEAESCQSDLSLSKHSSALLQLSFQVMKVFASNFEDRTDSDTYVT
ncbi:hypothetical protein Tco_0952087 [Tanacetum coccineum]|uniref:Uncharacterized protein n=1 Tax=Tanacetum coccineum TaxID=301880 RepID=A0ABQ5DWT4_9ASTR